MTPETESRRLSCVAYVVLVGWLLFLPICYECAFTDQGGTFLAQVLSLQLPTQGSLAVLTEAWILFCVVSHMAMFLRWPRDEFRALVVDSFSGQGTNADGLDALPIKIGVLPGYLLALALAS